MASWIIQCSYLLCVMSNQGLSDLLSRLRMISSCGSYKHLTATLLDVIALLSGSFQEFIFPGLSIHMS